MHLPEVGVRHTPLGVFPRMCVSICAFCMRANEHSQALGTLSCVLRAQGREQLSGSVTRPEDSQFGVPGHRPAAAGLRAALPAWRASPASVTCFLPLGDTLRGQVCLVVPQSSTQAGTAPCPHPLSVFAS